VNQTHAQWVSKQVLQMDAQTKYMAPLILRASKEESEKKQPTRSPSECRDLLMYIRHAVERPWTPGTGLTKYTKDCLVFRNHPRWGRDVESCPLGLLPEALCARPSSLGHFHLMIAHYVKGIKQGHIDSFVRWWDSQTNGEKAVGTIWGWGL